MTSTTGHSYFDWNATAPLSPRAREAMAVAFDVTGNPASVHGAGRAARAILERARTSILKSLAAPDATLVFTSGGSEAAVLGLRGLVQSAAAKGERITRLIVSAIEHDCILETARAMAEDTPGLRLTILPAAADGAVSPGALSQALMEGKGRALVALMLANNETGVIQPVAECARIAKAHSALILSDVVQVWGRIPVDFAALGLDAAILSPHKAGGPKGIGALVMRPGLALAPQITGGGQELGLRAGTPNVAGAAGFCAIADLNADWSALAAKRDLLQAALTGARPEAIVYGAGARLPNVLCIGLPGVLAETQVMALDLDGVSVSAGSACSSGKVKPSRVLAAMGASPEQAASAIRISFGPDTGPQDFARLTGAWTAMADRTARQDGRHAA
jgi:cysteine desulfurase